jgi:selenoprotein W-related protein
LADELQQSLGIEATLVPGSGGIFDVIVDGKLIFSKYDSGRYPNPGEITSLLQS